MALLTGNSFGTIASGPLSLKNKTIAPDLKILPGTNFGNLTLQQLNTPGFKPSDNVQGITTPQNQSSTSPNVQDIMGGTNNNAGGASGLTPDQINQMINQAMTKNGQDPYNMQGQGTDQLNQILNLIKGSFQNNQQAPNYLDILNQSRQQYGIPDLLNQLQQNQQQQAQLQAGLNLGKLDIQGQPIPLGLQQGQQAILEQQNAVKGQYLAQQGANIQNQLGIAQNLGGQNLQAAQAQGQLGLGQQQLQTQQGLGLGGLAAQIFGLSKGAYQPFTNPMTGEVGVFNQNTGQFQGIGGGSGGTSTGNNTDPYSSVQSFQQAFPGLGATMRQDANGQYYFNTDNLPQGVSTAALQNAAQKLQLPVLNNNLGSALQSIDNSLGLMPTIQDLITKNLDSGTGGRISDVAKTALNDWFQTNPDLTQLNNYGLQAISVIRSLGGPGSGVRVTNTELSQAQASQPESSDNQETAMRKVKTLTDILSEIRQNIYNDNTPGGNPSVNGGSGQSNSNSNSVGWF